MNAGAVGAVLISGVNPFYTYADSKNLTDGLSKVVSVSFNATMDETTERCNYIIPDHHWLESWGDAEPKTGYFSLIQPVINPLFKTRAFQTSLIKWSAAAGSLVNDYETYFKTYWTAKLGNADLYAKALQDGVVEPATMPVGVGVFNAGRLSDAVTTINEIKTGINELVLSIKSINR